MINNMVHSGWIAIPLILLTMGCHWGDVVSYARPIPDFIPIDPPPGFPDEDSTGITVDVTELSDDLSSLESTSLGYRVSSGTVQGLEIDGRLIIDGDNVTVRNCRIWGDDTISGYGIEIKSGNGILIEDNTIGKEADSWPNGQKGICILVDANVQAIIRQNHIRYVDDGIITGNGSSSEPSAYRYELTIEENYINYVHSWAEGEPTTSVHNFKGDGIECLGPLYDTVIANNSIDIPTNQTSAILVQPNWGNLDNLMISDNWLNGAGWTLKVRSRNHEITNVTITGNRFGSAYISGPFDCDIDIDTMYDNRWAETGELVVGMNP